MRNTLIATGCMLLISAASFAQAPAQAAPSTQATQATQQTAKHPKLTDDQKVDKEVAKLDEIVHLTPDQLPKVKQLFTTLLTQKEQNKAAANGDMEKLKELNKAVGEQRKNGLKAILTKEQHAALKAANHEKKAEKMENGR